MSEIIVIPPNEEFLKMLEAARKWEEVYMAYITHSFAIPAEMFGSGEPKPIIVERLSCDTKEQK